jgi:hypothetical protein
MTLPETYDVEPGKFYLGHWHGISITIWADQADAEFVRRAVAMGKHWATHYPARRTSVCFVLRGVATPTPEARAAFEAMHSGRTGIVCVGVVVEGDGFWASALRATVTSINLAGNGVAVRTEPSIEALAPWVAREHALRVGETFSDQEILQILTTARYELAPRLLFPSATA